MEEAVKNRIILILSILSAILFISSVSSCANAARQRSARDNEMSTRLDLEEKINKFSQEKSVIESKMQSALKDLGEEKEAHKATQNELSQEKLVNKSLKEELQKVVKLKEALEKDLKEALVNTQGAVAAQ